MKYLAGVDHKSMVTGKGNARTCKLRLDQGKIKPYKIKASQIAPGQEVRNRFREFRKRWRIFDVFVGDTVNGGRFGWNGHVWIDALMVLLQRAIWMNFQDCYFDDPVHIRPNPRGF